MRRIVFRVITAVLAAVLLLTGALGSTMQAKAMENIKYTDLFYGYDSSYLNSRLLQLHSKSVGDMIFTIYNDYCDSDEFKWTAVKDGIKAATNLSEFYKLMSDTYGDTDYNFEDAVDQANIMLASKLLDSSLEFGMADRCMEGVGAIQSLCEFFEDEHIVSAMDDFEVFAKFFQTAKEKQLWDAVGEISVNQTLVELSEETKFSKMLSYVGDGYEAAKTIAVGLMMENLRMEIIDDIITNSPTDSTIYEGMTTLKQQLRDGFVSYFVDNYVTDQAMKKINEFAVKKLAEFALGNLAACYNVVGTLVRFASTIVFDVIMDVPGVDDLTVQKVLDEYASDLYMILVNTKIPQFDSQFDSNAIVMYEAMFNTYLAAFNAALEASEKLALDSNEAKLDDIILTWSDVTYDNYIFDIKQTIATEQESERKLKMIDNWNIDSSVVICDASDDVEDDFVYLFNGEFRANVTFTGDYVLASPQLSIAGNVTVNGRGITLTIPQGKTLCVGGSMTVNWYEQYNYSTYFGNLDLRGTLRVTGDFNVGYYGYYYPSETAELYVGGNYSVNDSRYGVRGVGTVIFNGTEQQNVYYLVAGDVTVTNTKGIAYTSEAYVYGHYALNNNPLSIGNYCTYMYSTTTFDDSDFILVKPAVNMTLNTDVKANVTVDSRDVMLTVAESTDHTIDGDLIVEWKQSGYSSYRSYLELKGTLRVTGNFLVGYYGYFSAFDTAQLFVSGNYSVDSSRYSGTSFKVIFNGTEAQNAAGVYCKTVILENTSEAGVNLSSVSCSRLFDHRGNVFTLSGTNSFVDYDADGIIDNMDPEPVLRDGCVIANSVILYENGAPKAAYSTFADALADYDSTCQYLKLTADLVAVGELTQPLYIDLAGFDLSGILYTDDQPVMLMDSTTDRYTCDRIGFFSCTDEKGNAVIPQLQWKTDEAVCGAIMRYMTLSGEAGYSAHRYYLGITHVTMKPNTDGMGYKAVFAGDEMVLSNVENYGYILSLGNFTPHTMSKTGHFESGETVTLRIDHFDVDKFAETDLSAQVFINVNGETIYSTEVTTTLKNTVEAINANAGNYSQPQLAVLKSMIERFSIMREWKVEDILSA